jgi:hypothetical protein
MGATEALAQVVPYQPAYTNPAVPPIINLARPGSNPAINYYGIVRPQVDFRNSMLRLQQGQAALGQEIGTEQAGGLPTTGHAAFFMNYSTYFLNNNLQAGGGPARRPQLTTPTVPTVPTPAAPATGVRR